MLGGGAGRRTKSRKGVPQVILVDEAIPVLIHDGEGLQKGGDCLVSPGEIVGSSPRDCAKGWGKWDSGIFKEHRGILGIRSGVTIGPSNFMLPCIPKRNESMDPYKHLCVNIHISTIHNSSKLING